MSPEPAQPVVLYIAGRARPHELFLLAVSAVTGVAYLVGVPPSTSLLAVVPIWQIRIWAVLMLASGIVGLLGSFYSRRHVEFGLQLEAAGMLMGSGAVLLLAAAAFTYAGWRSLGVGLTYGSWAAANLYRAWQIRRDLHGLTTTLR